MSIHLTVEYSPECAAGCQHCSIGNRSNHKPHVIPEAHAQLMESMVDVFGTQKTPQRRMLIGKDIQSILNPSTIPNQAETYGFIFHRIDTTSNHLASTVANKISACLSERKSPVKNLTLATSAHSAQEIVSGLSFLTKRYPYIREGISIEHPNLPIEQVLLTVPFNDTKEDPKKVIQEAHEMIGGSSSDYYQKDPDTAEMREEYPEYIIDHQFTDFTHGLLTRSDTDPDMEIFFVTGDTFAQDTIVKIHSRILNPKQMPEHHRGIELVQHRRDRIYTDVHFFFAPLGIHLSHSTVNSLDDSVRFSYDLIAEVFSSKHLPTIIDDLDFLLGQRITQLQETQIHHNSPV